MSFYRELYANESLPARARLVYMYLRDRSNRDGLCWPAIGTIARETKLSGHVEYVSQKQKATWFADLW